MAKRKALGKGLSALIPDANGGETDNGGFFQCPVEMIEPNPFQPRQDFKNAGIEELVLSIKEKGVITPILVSKVDEGYRLIAGERRWRAAQKAGLKRVPVVVRETTPIESLELALIENIHRKDLNPLEEAQAYKRWLEDTQETQESLARKVGKERSTITNMLRLLTLPDFIQKDLIDDRLTMGHARVLAGLKSRAEQKEIRDLILQKSLSVRQAENLLKIKSAPPKSKDDTGEQEHYLRSLADGLRKALGTKVEIKKRGRRGRITIHFYSDDELDRLLELLT